MSVRLEEERRGWFRRRSAPWALGVVEDREVPAAPAEPVRTFAPAMFPTTTAGVPVVSPSNALAVADVFACVRCLADAAASIPLIPYRNTPDGRTRAEGRLSGLLRRPAPATTTANLIGTAMAHLQLYGNAFLGKFRDADGRVEQLALLHPDRVTVELRDGRLVYTVNDGRGRQSEHGVEDIIHVRGLSTDGLVGVSPVRACRVAMGLSASLAAHANHFFENGARPTGILRVPAFPDGPDGVQADTFAAEFSTNELGLRNAHKIAVVTGDEPLDFTQLTGALDDLQFVQQRHLSTAEIARIFRVPPWMVGASSGDSMTYSNTESQALAFVTHSLRPWLVLIEQAISEDADLCPGSLYCEFLLDALLRADSKTRSEVYAAARARADRRECASSARWPVDTRRDGTGLRQGELAALRWRDVDWSAGVVRVRRNYTRGEWGTPKSRRSTRAVPLADRVAAELDRHYKRSAHQADDDLVLCHPQTGRPYDASRMRERFYEAMHAAGLGQLVGRENGITFHSLRHTFGTRMAAVGVPMRTLQEWMGHKDYATTLIYADFAPDATQGAAFAELAFGPSTNPSTNLRPSGTNSDPLRADEHGAIG